MVGRLSADVWNNPATALCLAVSMCEFAVSFANNLEF